MSVTSTCASHTRKDEEIVRGTTLGDTLENNILAYPPKYPRKIKNPVSKVETGFVVESEGFTPHVLHHMRHDPNVRQNTR